MVVTNDRNYWIREINGGKNVSTHAGMRFHLLEFGWGQSAGLIEDIFRHRELSHVMKQRGSFNGSYLGRILYANSASQADCVVLNSPNVTMRDLILCVDGHSQRLDG